MGYTKGSGKKGTSSKKAAGTKKAAGPKKDDDSVPVSIIPVLSKDQKPAYANHLNISHSHNDFLLAFSNVQPAILSEKERERLEATGELVIDPTATVVVPVTIMSKIIDAMIDNYTRYLVTNRDNIKLSDSDIAILEEIDKRSNK